MDLSNISINVHSSIRVAGSKIIYFDPFEIADEAGDADIIFVSHEHYDHFDPASIAKIKNDGTILVAPESMKKKALAESGIATDNCVFYEPNTCNELAGLTVQAVPAYNKMKPFHAKSAKWLGYIVTMDGIKYYFAGDTDMNEDVQKVQCDVAMLPIGGFYTMDKKQAAELTAVIKPQVVIPMHYGKIVGKADDGEAFKKLVEASGYGVQVELKI